MSQESIEKATDPLAEAENGDDAVGETAVITDAERALSPKIKKLIIPVLILVALQVVAMIIGRILKQRYLRQAVGEDEVNAVGVMGAAEEKITAQAFKGGYVRAVMGGVELDLSEAAIETPPATIEATVVISNEAVLDDSVTQVAAASVQVGGIAYNEAIPDRSSVDHIDAAIASIAEGLVINDQTVLDRSFRQVNPCANAISG